MIYTYGSYNPLRPMANEVDAGAVGRVAGGKVSFYARDYEIKEHRQHGNVSILRTKWHQANDSSID